MLDPFRSYSVVGSYCYYAMWLSRYLTSYHNFFVYLPLSLRLFIDRKYGFPLWEIWWLLPSKFLGGLVVRIWHFHWGCPGWGDIPDASEHSQKYCFYPSAWQLAIFRCLLNEWIGSWNGWNHIIKWESNNLIKQFWYKTKHKSEV